MRSEEKVAKLLIDQKKTLSVAESCTGGLLSNRLTNISGSTKYFRYGVVCYSNESKIQLLKVSGSLITKYGAVSEKVATSMARGIRKIQKTDFGIGISGIAGPTGGTKTKPVGLVFIAVATAKETICLKCIFEGTRTQIKSKATTQALKLLLEFLI